MSDYPKSFYQVFSCFSADKFDYDEDAVLFESDRLSACHNFAYLRWIERKDDTAWLTIIQPYDGSCRGGYGFPEDDEPPSEVELLKQQIATLTRQRDLAVEAIEKSRPWLSGIANFNSRKTMRILETALYAIKKSEK